MCTYAKLSKMCTYVKLSKMCTYVKLSKMCMHKAGFSSVKSLATLRGYIACERDETHKGLFDT